MLLFWVVILAINVSFRAHVPCFLTCCAVSAAEFQVDTAQIRGQTLTKGSYSSLCVAVTKKLYLPGLQGCSPSCENISLS